MGRVDPMDLLLAPPWVPRLTRIGGAKVMAEFRGIVEKTMDDRRQLMRSDPASAPQDFLTLLLQLEGPDGLSTDEISDNILTFIGAGHETTARALAWTLYCVANSPHVRENMEAEIDSVLSSGAEPVDWLDLMPHVRAAFEEGMRLYPPAPSINRAAIKADSWTSPEGRAGRDPQGHLGPDHALDAASPCALLGKTARLHAGTVPAGKPRQAAPVPVPAFRGRPAHLHRCHLCACRKR